MFRMCSVLVALTVACAVTLAPAAHAADPVVYEIRSSTVSTANIQWSDTAGEHALRDVQLPWRVSVSVENARTDAARLSATWQPGSATTFPNPGRYMWVTLRIYTKGSLLCEITLDVGAATCSGRGYYADQETPR